jgi:endonuclease YncB( thermonuclease family)
MKKLTKFLALLLLICTIVSSLASCDLLNSIFGGGGETPIELVDYVGQLELDMTSNTLKQEVTVKSYIDGDTTHFFVPESVRKGGVLKARYLAVNTPESTGKIEEWGKKASNFTKTKLKEAESIIIESDDDKWNADSTGDRFLVWVWYKLPGSDKYRNLNIELLQEGLAIASNSSQNRYGTICMQALQQAELAKLNVNSKEKDPDFYYGAAIELTLSELRANIASYNGARVAFNAVVTKEEANAVYVEAFDEETGIYNGVYIYYGFTLSAAGMKMLSVGNELRIVGTVSYWEEGDSYQISDLQYRSREPDDPKNLKLLSTGNAVAYVETSADTFNNAKVDRVVIEEGEEILKSFDYAELCIGTSISMKNLKVVKTYTTTNETSSSKGAMTLTCQVDGETVDIRTIVLYDADGKLVTADRFAGKTIDVKGIIDCYDGAYQIKVFSVDDIIVH